MVLVIVNNDNETSAQQKKRMTQVLFFAILNSGKAKGERKNRGELWVMV